MGVLGSNLVVPMPGWLHAAGPGPGCVAVTRSLGVQSCEPTKQDGTPACFRSTAHIRRMFAYCWPAITAPACLAWLIDEPHVWELYSCTAPALQEQFPRRPAGYICSKLHMRQFTHARHAAPRQHARIQNPQAVKQPARCDTMRRHRHGAARSGPCCLPVQSMAGPACWPDGGSATQRATAHMWYVGTHTPIWPTTAQKGGHGRMRTTNKAATMRCEGRACTHHMKYAGAAARRLLAPTVLHAIASQACKPRSQAAIEGGRATLMAGPVLHACMCMQGGLGPGLSAGLQRLVLCCHARCHAMPCYAVLMMGLPSSSMPSSSAPTNTHVQQGHAGVPLAPARSKATHAVYAMWRAG